MTFRHPGTPSVHELYTLIGSFRRHRLRFSRFSLSLFPRLSFYLSLPLLVFGLAPRRTPKGNWESTHTKRSPCVQMTLIAEEGYPPINRASQCTPSVVALQYTSRREITPRRWISVIINALYLAPSRSQFMKYANLPAAFLRLRSFSRTLRHAYLKISQVENNEKFLCIIINDIAITIFSTYR